MRSSKWFQASDKLVSCLHCLGRFFSLIKASLWKDAVFFGVFQITPLFEKESKPHGAEYLRQKSLGCPHVATSVCGIGIIIRGMLLQWFVECQFRPWAKKTQVAHRSSLCSAQKSHCFSYPSCSFSLFFKLISSSLKAFKNAFNSKAFLFVYETCGYVKSVESFLFHHCGACVRSWFLCLLGLCFWFCKAETVYLERGGKCVCKSVPL